MSYAPAIRALRTAAIVRLKSSVPLVEGRVYTPPIPTNAAFPYLVVYSYSERYAGHYGHGGSAAGFDVRGVAKSEQGDAPLMALYEQVYTALMGHALAADGHWTAGGELRFVTDYADPDDEDVRHFVARYETTTAVVP